MTFHPNHAELEFLGREMQRAYLKEAERQRVIREVTLANPTWERKLWLIFRDRWAAFWKGKRDSKSYRPISAIPGKSNI